MLIVVGSIGSWVQIPNPKALCLTPRLPKNSEDQHPKARIIAHELQVSKSLARFLALGIAFELSQ